MSIDVVDLPPFTLGCYRKVLPTTGAGLPTSIKAKGKTLQVRLPAQAVLIGGMWHSKPGTMVAACCFPKHPLHGSASGRVLLRVFKVSRISVWFLSM